MASLLVSCVECERLHKPEHPLDLSPRCAACSGRYGMASLRMGRCHPLTEETVDGEVTRRSAGNYALGYLDDGVFIVFYVGRSDADLNERLRSWVGADSRPHRHGPFAQAPYGSRRRGPSRLRAPALRPVGVVVDGRYTHFEFSYAASAEAAFEKECENYHDFGGSFGLDNERHPVPPPGTSWSCPVGELHPI